MKYLLEQDGLRALEAFCMSNALFAFDYDGTLAPIVDDPSVAIMRPVTSNLLSELVSFTPVALITGRSRADVSRLLQAKVDYVIGNHGLEGIPGGSPSLESAELSCKKWNAQLTAELMPDGVTVEDKKYSLAVHYRMAADKRAAKTRILEWVGSLEPSPRIVMGKCVVNLISAGAPHKGVALLEVMLRSGCRSAVYFGDDDNDEDVFRLGEESLLTIRIGKSENSSALFYLNSQDEIDQVLRVSLAAMMKSGKSVREAIKIRNEYESANNN
jgi:trehalose 6-phosphate phosphatase